MHTLFYAVGVICSAIIPLNDFGQCGLFDVKDSPFQTKVACESAQATALNNFWTDPNNLFKPGQEFLYIKAGCIERPADFDPASKSGTALVMKLYGPGEGMNP
jgi:hypothetical protein